MIMLSYQLVIYLKHGGSSGLVYLGKIYKPGSRSSETTMTPLVTSTITTTRETQVLDILIIETRYEIITRRKATLSVIVSI